ncbi:hypothetical protein HMPREF9582_02390 [Cutibacterium acnes HL060PA1]|nr:hypothetical protein HMPREF9603_00220 [Cutibacterium acnes HL001PA1]EFT25779.1 hypothetical protein HMPREF9577_01730 [Cutibacterium acnes HL110PA3]EFT66666.1 hypothetical protein HMPREF9582_02390 [Cutibacterium acnes HL060PA1]MCW5113582.1 hypothetical protein [Cutibacterium acnes P05]
MGTGRPQRGQRPSISGCVVTTGVVDVVKPRRFMRSIVPPPAP